MLILKPNGIFGIVRNDSLISYGKLTILATDATQYYPNSVDCNFDFDKKTPIELSADTEKYIQINHDSLNLIAPCCDRFNTHFIRKK